MQATLAKRASTSGDVTNRMKLLSSVLYFKMCSADEHKGTYKYSGLLCTVTALEALNVEAPKAFLDTKLLCTEVLKLMFGKL